MSRKIFIFLIFMLLLAGCNYPRRETPTLPPPATLTPAWAPTSDVFAPPSPTVLIATAFPTFTPAASRPGSSGKPSPSPMTEPETATATPPPLTGEPITITRIAMLNRLDGWGIGYLAGSGARIVFTEDGGQSWSDRTPPDPLADNPAEAESAWAYFADENNAWVIYAPQQGPPSSQPPGVWKTTDGGHTWNISSPLPATGDGAWFTPETFVFADTQHGWLLVHVGAGMSHDYSELFATQNAGQTWERVADPYGAGLQSLYNTGMAFADRQFGWVTKDNIGVMPGAFLEQTIDGGITWTDVFLPSPPDFDWETEVSLCATESPTFLTPQAGLVIVNCRTFEGEQTYTYVYRTADRGTTWTWAQLPSPVDSLLFIGQQNGWAFGRDFYQSTDGGRAWVQFKTVTWDGQFSFADALYGWAVARKNDKIALVSTANGGKTWQLIEPVIR